MTLVSHTALSLTFQETLHLLWLSRQKLSHVWSHMMLLFVKQCYYLCSKMAYPVIKIVLCKVGCYWTAVLERKVFSVREVELLACHRSFTSGFSTLGKLDEIFTKWKTFNVQDYCLSKRCFCAQPTPSSHRFGRTQIRFCVQFSGCNFCTSVVSISK